MAEVNSKEAYVRDIQWSGDNWATTSGLQMGKVA